MKKLITFLNICLVCIMFVSCNKGINKIGSKDKLNVFATFSDAQGFRKTIADGMESYADSNDINLDLEIADTNIETQVKQVKKAKEKGYDIIVCLLVDADTSQQIINAAGDIPVIFTSVEPDESKLKEDKYIYVASDENKVVDYMFEYLSDYFKNNKSFNAVILEGNRKQKCTVIRTDGLKEKLKANGFHVDYVFQDTANWSQEKSKNIMKILLKLNKKFDCVICNNDDMAMGVADGLQECGIDPSKTPILGVDAISEACEYISDGRMAFSVKQSGEGQGESVMKAAQALKKGQKIKDLEYADKSGKYIWYPYTKVNKDNASEYIEK